MSLKTRARWPGRCPAFVWAWSKPVVRKYPVMQKPSSLTRRFSVHTATTSLTRVTVFSHRPGSGRVDVPDVLSDPFVDLVTMELRPVVETNMTQLFRGITRIGRLRCGRGTIHVQVSSAGDSIEVKGCPAKILRGSNAYPGMCNVRLIKSFLAEVAKALSDAAESGPSLCLYVAAVSQIDLTIMVDLGDPVLARAVFAMLRMVLRCRFPEIEGEHARDFLARVLYANTIWYRNNSGDTLIKIYRKSVEQKQDPNCDPEIDLDNDTSIRIEITLSSTYAAKLLGREKPLSLPELIKHARALFDVVTRRFVIMSRQCMPLKRVKSPVPEYPDAYEAWLLHGWTNKLYPGDATAVVCAYRDRGIDLAEPPVPERDRDRFAIALGVGVVDLLDLDRVRRIKPSASAAAPQGSQLGQGGLGTGSAPSRRENLSAGLPGAPAATAEAGVWP